jgi:hypothetical protein
MTMMSVLAPNGALVAGTLEQALGRFKDSSVKNSGPNSSAWDELCLGVRFRV